MPDPRAPRDQEGLTLIETRSGRSAGSSAPTRSSRACRSRSQAHVGEPLGTASPSWRTACRSQVRGGRDVEIDADPDQLEQLLINLVRNAVDAALETGGGVWIDWQQRRRAADDGRGRRARTAGPRTCSCRSSRPSRPAPASGSALPADRRGARGTCPRRRDGPGSGPRPAPGLARRLPPPPFPVVRSSASPLLLPPLFLFLASFSPYRGSRFPPHPGCSPPSPPPSSLPPPPPLRSRIDRLADLATRSGGLHAAASRCCTRSRRDHHAHADAADDRRPHHERLSDLASASRRLNDAGLDYLQISIDNVEPDEVSKKSLRLLDQKLRWLAEYAAFDVNINSVVGAAIKHPGGRVEMARAPASSAFDVHRHHPRRPGAIGRCQPRSVGLRGPEWKLRQLVQDSRVNAASRTTSPTGSPTLELPRRRALPLRVRRRPRALLFATARPRPAIPLERYTVDDIRRAPDAEVVRALLHDRLQPPGLNHGRRDPQHP